MPVKFKKKKGIYNGILYVVLTASKLKSFVEYETDVGPRLKG